MKILRPMRILVLTWDFPPIRGGIQTWMLELARRLPRAEVRVLAPTVPGAPAFDRSTGIPLTRLASARLGLGAWVVAAAARTLWECVVRRPDLVVCGHVVAAPAALLARRLLGVPYVVFAYGYEIRKERKRSLTFLLRNAKNVVACSRFAGGAVQTLGVPGDRIRILYPGVDTERFTPDESAFRPARPPTFFAVGRLAELYKGHDTVIRALPLVRAKCPNARFLIAGDGPLRGYLSRIAHSVGMAEHVEFLGDVSDGALPDLYRSSDVVVQLSRESLSENGAEGFGIVCLEAAACGKPVVAGRSGGLIEAVQDGVTGTLVDPLDGAAVADAIVALLEDPALARRLGRAGRERVLVRFTWSHMAERARRIFADAAGIHG
jgi:phosphatidylinositol alpha-1,6-mannosyltransferase